MPLLGEEHRLAFSEGGPLGEEVCGDREKLFRWLRLLAGRDRLKQGRLGGIEIRGELNSREVETLCRLIETVADAVFGQSIGNVERGEGENIAESLFIFNPIEPPQRHATVGEDGGVVGIGQHLRQGRQQGFPLRLGQIAGVWRHLPLRHAVVHKDELFADGRGGEVGEQDGD